MRLFVPLIFLLAGCDSPSLGFAGVPARRAEVDGMVFSVRLRDDRAEAIRLSSAWLPKKRDVLSRAATAITQVSGCEVDSIDGDQSIIRADLDCPPER